MAFIDLSLSFYNIVSTKHIEKDIGYTSVWWSVDLISKDLDNPDLFFELNRPDIWEQWLPFTDLRQQYKTNSSPLIQDLINIISGPKSKEFMYHAFHSNPKVFGYHWPHDLKYYLDKCHVAARILKDYPSFNMGIHRDNNTIIAQYIVNLGNNETSTSFYGLNDTEIYRAPTEHKKGIGFLNTSASRHAINSVNKERYILYFSLLM